MPDLPPRAVPHPYSRSPEWHAYWHGIWTAMTREIVYDPALRTEARRRARYAREEYAALVAARKETR